MGNRVRIETILTFTNSENGAEWSHVLPNGSSAAFVDPDRETWLCKITGPTHVPYYLMPNGKTEKRAP